ncbi:MAG: universal stress protein [Gilvibacter sp.]
MKTKILVLTDFSKNAYTALNYAIELFKQSSCEFYILNAFTPSTYVSDNILATQLGNHDLEALKQTSKKGLETLEQLISSRDKDPDHSFTYVSEFDFVHKAVVKAVQKYNIDLIVMGTHGESDSSQALFGSITVSIMNKVRDCTTLVVPKGHIYEPLKEVVFLSSYRTPYKSLELRPLLTIAARHKAHLSVLHVSKDEEQQDQHHEIKDALSHKLQDLSPSFYEINGVSLPDALQCFVQIKESDMIAFVNKKHHFFENLFSPSMVKDLAKHAQVPILCLHHIKN